MICVQATNSSGNIEPKTKVINPTQLGPCRRSYVPSMSSDYDSSTGNIELLFKPAVKPFYSNDIKNCMIALNKVDTTVKFCFNRSK